MYADQEFRLWRAGIVGLTTILVVLTLSMALGQAYNVSRGLCEQMVVGNTSPIWTSCPSK